MPSCGYMIKVIFILNPNIMKPFVLTFLLLFAIKAKSQQKKESFKSPLSNQFWDGKDKGLHIASTFGVSTATYTFLSLHPKYKNYSTFNKRLISFGSAMLVGLVKETFDGMQKDKVFNPNDMVANLMGSLAFQASVTIPLNFKKKEDPFLYAVN